MNLPAECVRWEDATFNCGIYFLILDGELVYIGQSVDLRKRLANHEHHYDVVFLLSIEMDRLNDVESEWIRRLAPRLNYQHNQPPTKMFNVRLPEEIIQQLEKVAKDEGTTMAAIFTQAVDAYLQTDIS